MFRSKFVFLVIVTIFRRSLIQPICLLFPQCVTDLDLQRWTGGHADGDRDLLAVAKREAMEETGVADDKGPSILCLYALKYLKDNGVTLKYPVRALLGANEETNMHDVDYFAAHFEQPAFCFTPDAEFPVCNGEKGGFGGELVSPVLENGVIVDFVGGVAHNAVPDRAACTVRLPESALKQTEGVTFEAGENGTTIIRGWGKSGHAAMPQGTVNAIGLIVTCLLESKVCSPAETAYLQVLHTLHATTDGSALGIAASDDVFDPLTIIGGTIEMKDGRLRQSFDCRYPTSTTAEHLTEMMTQVCGTAATLEDVSSRVPFYIAADQDGKVYLLPPAAAYVPTW